MDMTKKLTKALIEMYWERKCLWQVKSDEYKRRNLKKKCYLQIVMFLRRNGVRDASVKLVRDKIQNMRRAMRKEKKKIDESNGTYSPTLWYYDLLTFVSDQNEGVATETNKVKLNVDITGDADSNEELLQCKPTKGKKVADRTSSNLKCNENTETAVTKIRKAGEQEAMGINFAAKIGRMELNQQIFAELLIHKVLAKGLLGQLSESTEILDLIPEGEHLVRLGHSIAVTSSNIIEPYVAKVNNYNSNL